MGAVAVTKKFVGEKLSLTLVRNGEEHSVEVTAEPRKYLIPPHEEQHGVAVPNYFIHAGLVFIGLNENYVGHVDAEPIVGIASYFLLVLAGCGLMMLMPAMVTQGATTTRTRSDSRTSKWW